MNLKSPFTSAACGFTGMTVTGIVPARRFIPQIGWYREKQRAEIPKASELLRSVRQARTLLQMLWAQ